MLSLSERIARRRSLRSWAVLLLTITFTMTIVPLAGVTSTVVAQDDAPAAAPTADAGGADTTVKSKNFLSWMIEALGPFWMLIFAALSFVMVALIMMNLLQVRRDVLLPNEFVEEFDRS